MERRRAGGSGQGRSCPLVAAGAWRRAAARGLRGGTATGCHGGASREQPLAVAAPGRYDSSLSTIFGTDGGDWRAASHPDCSGADLPA